MFYVLIVVLIYVLYVVLKYILRSKEDWSNIIQQREGLLLNNIKTSFLKDHLRVQLILLECEKKNFIRLKERFKHDDVKLKEITNDWVDYMNTLDDIITERELLDISISEDSETHWKKIDELNIKIQETGRRFKYLLDDEYEDPMERMAEEPTTEERLKELLSKRKKK